LLVSVQAGIREEMAGTPADFVNLPTAHEGRVADNFIRIMKPIAKSETVLQTQAHVTVSIAWPYTCSTMHKLREFSRQQQMTPEGRAFARALYEDYASHLEKNFVRTTALVATLLDPRMKRQRYLPVDSRQLTYQYLHDAAVVEHALMQKVAAAAAGDCDAVPSSVDEQGDAIDADMPALVDLTTDDDFHDFGADEEADARGPFVSDVASEIRTYMALPSLDSGYPVYRPNLQANPLSWWKDHQGTLPILANLARKYLAIPATSASPDTTSLIRGGV
jgi:hypothetical protein